MLRARACVRGEELTEHFLDLDLVVERDAVGDHVLLLDEVEPLGDDGVVFVLVFADLEQDLDHVLDALVDGALVQDGAEAVKDAVVGAGRVLGEEGADLAHERDGNLDAVVGRALEQEDEHLQGEDLVRDLLIDELGEEGGGGGHGRLVVALVAPAELVDEAVEQEFADLGQLGVDDGDERGKDGGERQRRGLGAHDGADKEALAADEVLAKEFGDDELDVGRVDLIDETVDALAECVPGQSLVVVALVVVLGLLGEEGAEAVRGHVGAASARGGELLDLVREVDLGLGCVCHDLQVLLGEPLALAFALAVEVMVRGEATGRPGTASGRGGGARSGRPVGY